jgi:hypothetical protein
MAGTMTRSATVTDTVNDARNDTATTEKAGSKR